MEDAAFAVAIISTAMVAVVLALRRPRHRSVGCGGGPVASGGPSLAGMRLAAASIRERLRGSTTTPDPVTDDLLSRIEVEAGESVHTIRQILAELRPLSIDDLGVSVRFVDGR